MRVVLEVVAPIRRVMSANVLQVVRVRSAPTAGIVDVVSETTSANDVEALVVEDSSM